MRTLLKIDLKSFKRDKTSQILLLGRVFLLSAISLARINAILIRDSFENNRKWKIFKFTLRSRYSIFRSKELKKHVRGNFSSFELEKARETKEILRYSDLIVLSIKFFRIEYLCWSVKCYNFEIILSENHRKRRRDISPVLSARLIRYKFNGRVIC